MIVFCSTCALYWEYMVYVLTVHERYTASICTMYRVMYA